MRLEWSLTTEPSGNAQQGWKPKRWGTGSHGSCQGKSVAQYLSHASRALFAPRKHMQVLRYISSTKWKLLRNFKGNRVMFISISIKNKNLDWPPLDMKLSVLLERVAFQVFLSFNLTSMSEIDECWFKIGLLFLSLCCFL